MKVVLVGAGMIPIPPPGYGAVEKHIWNLALALEARGHEVRIVNRVFGSTSKDEYRFALWARKEVAREPYDVLHLHTPGVASIFAAAGPRRWVYTTHSRHWAGAKGAGERVGFFLERRAVGAAQEVVAVSRFVAQQIPRATHVVPNGVDVERYAPRPSARTGRLVVGVGEIAEHKQWHVAAEAMRGLDAQLRIVGPIRDVAYARRVEAAGAQLMGALDEADLTRALGEADVLVHPSVSESFGMAVVEGMSAGLPVVCSDILSFLVTHGEQGFLIPTGGGDEDRVRRAREFIS
ncbi:MAG TPA: glycosyltransferase family 4 protein, partial [Candidatus Thermoplasmatota archaeon]|nr:glycosyltransferase family 4 protein [Candidatus Thermoplasmatota archaeon]